MSNKGEREGFEPLIVLCFELYQFSRPELSTTRPPLMIKLNYLYKFTTILCTHC